MMSCEIMEAFKSKTMAAAIEESSKMWLLNLREAACVFASRSFSSYSVDNSLHFKCVFPEFFMLPGTICGSLTRCVFYYV